MTNRRAAGPVGLLPSLIELLLPRACVGCGRDGTVWCPDCVAVEFDPVLHRPDPCPPGLPLLAASAPYSGSVRRAILAAKERDRRELDRLLGVMLATAIGHLMTADGSWPVRTGPLWLVPVPASPSALRQRGRDHVGDWTSRALRCLTAAGVAAHHLPVLRRTSAGVDSVGLDAGQREVNLSGAFALGRASTPPPGTTVIVVDDIVTTGATLVAASECLATGLALAPVQLGAAVVAATQRHGERPGNTWLSLADRGRSH